LVVAGRVLYLGAARRSSAAQDDSGKGNAFREAVDVPKSAGGGHVVVMVTCGSHGEAQKIARHVVSERLAACVNILESRVNSVYRWKGKVMHSREVLLIIKTSRRRLAKLRTEIERLHSYDVPEFIALPVVFGSPAYLRWIDESLRG
jgi:periplasmic divalent cation tolerance protein